MKWTTFPCMVIDAMGSQIVRIRPLTELLIKTKAVAIGRGVGEDRLLQQDIFMCKYNNKLNNTLVSFRIWNKYFLCVQRWGFETMHAIYVITINKYSTCIHVLKLWKKLAILKLWKTQFLSTWWEPSMPESCDVYNIVV